VDLFGSHRGHTDQRPIAAELEGHSAKW
jgi:hypothetical protein